MIVVSKVYSTPNTALAAYLCSLGFDYLGADHTDPKNVVFRFSNSNKAMTESVMSFEIGRAEGNIIQFYLAYKRLVREVRP